MIRRTTAVIALLAFTNYILGCYSNQSITTSEATQTKAQIVQIVLKDGSIVKFNDAGGTYVLRGPGLTGKRTSGEPYFCPLSQIVCMYSSKAMFATNDQLAGRRIVETLYGKTRVAFDTKGGKFDSNRQLILGKDVTGKDVSLPLSDTKEIYTIDLTPISKEEYLQKPDQFIAEIITTSGRVFGINDSGAKYVGERAVIDGTTSTGQFVEIDVNDIVDAQVSRIDTGSSILAFLGILAGAGLIYFVIVLIAVSGMK